MESGLRRNCELCPVNMKEASMVSISLIHNTYLLIPPKRPHSKKSSRSVVLLTLFSISYFSTKEIESFLIIINY